VFLLRRSRIARGQVSIATQDNAITVRSRHQCDPHQ
jgi:hypothetical protein